MKNLFTLPDGGSQPLLAGAAQPSETKSPLGYLTDDVINEEPMDNIISGLLGFQTYDLRNVHFISNTGLAHMIDLLKNSFKRGIEIRFVNTPEKVKNKIRAMGMDHLFTCD